MEILQITWFVLTGVLVAAFLITGGCDYGAGIDAIFTNKKNRIFAVEGVLPFWDANQVWLITAGGALFAAFPPAYSVLLSTIYTPVILLLFCITVRIASIEFFAAAKGEDAKNAWAMVFSLSSFLCAVLIGTTLGAIFSGEIIPVKNGFIENLMRLFRPLTIAAAILTVLFFSVQGALFSAISADGRPDEIFWLRLSKKTLIFLMLGFILYVVIFAMHMPPCRLSKGAAMLLFVAAYIPLRIAYIQIKKVRIKTALLFTSLFAAVAIGAHAALAFPYIIPSREAGAGLSVFVASSGKTTLTVMLWVALTGVPLAIIYNIFCTRALFKKGESKKLY